ncbi:MAG: AarF/ABC1/UbiB kinase family protein, partial [Candidatus Methylomirabilis sp.]|nr:AarF/ABC1/UbiB kinase family protein [Deltaproteobacteria bacterium]
MAATLHPRRRLYSVLGTVGLIYGRALWTRGSRFRYRSREAYREARRGGRRLYRRILRLQGLFIKVGQFLSLRVDLFPREFAEELARLQDQVPPAPYEAIRERIVQELGAPPEEIFASFEKAPSAAASLGQVHEARLRSGERVVVKVQYPGIEDLVQVDLRILRRVLRLMRRLQPDLDYETVLSEFGKHVRMELDYANELANAERIRAELADRDDIVIPRFFPDLSTGKVVTLAFVEGIKITDAERLVAAGYDLGDITHRVIDCYARQILRHGFFHADPHPGNIFVLPGGRIALVDFGLAWELQPAVLAGLAKMAMSLIQQDA